MFFKRLCISSCIFSALASMQGCGGAAHEYDSVVTGNVTIDGELANTGTVVFHPVKDGRPATGRIHSDGSYSLRTGQGDLTQVDGGTVVSGEYLVTANITGPPPEGAVTGEGGPPISGPTLIASKYRQKDTTDLRFTVKPGAQVVTLDFERAEPSQETDSITETPTEDESEATESAPAGSPQDDAAIEATEAPQATDIQEENSVPASDNENE